MTTEWRVLEIRAGFRLRPGMEPTEAQLEELRIIGMAGLEILAENIEEMFGEGAIEAGAGTVTVGTAAPGLAARLDHAAAEPEVAEPEPMVDA
jgi:hypothetical protein